jgi:hypothetical protein
VLTLRHADGVVEQIRTTDEHPFHRLLDRGWWAGAVGVAADDVSDAGGRWTRADELAPGDRLTTLEGAAEVVAVSTTAERVPVYNLSIPEAPTYFVGQRGVWVHNCKIVKHHLFPQRFRDRFKRLGIDIDDPENLLLMPEDQHINVHRGGARGGSWNAMWESFFESFERDGRFPTKAQAEQQMRLMRDAFGI